MSFWEFLSYGFVWRALITGSFIAVVTALLGTFLILKRLSLLGDSLSHVALSGVALGLLMKTSPVFVTLPVVMISALGVYKVSRAAKVYSDGALGIISALGIALGLVIAKLAGGFNVDLMGFLFGSVLTVTTAQMWVSIALTAAVIALIYLYYNSLIACTFDENFAKTAGVDTDKINILLLFMASAAIAVALKVVGVLLVSAMTIIPPVSALQQAKTFRGALARAAVYSVLGVAGGIYFAFLFNLPSGAVIILADLFILFICALVKYVNKKRTSAARG